MIKKIFIIILLSLFSFSSNGFTGKQNDKKSSKLTVEADDSIEWFEKEKYYVAKGNVILKKDGFTLYANFVQAYYEVKNGENVLNKIIAKNDVTLTKENTKATSQLMTYNLNNKIAILTGPFQTLISESGYVESNKIIKFNDLKNKAEAEGNVKVILSNKTVIRADKINADLNKKDKSIKYAVARGNVFIENKIKGNKSKANLGIYNSYDEIIKLSGNVTLTNLNSTIRGSKGETNLKTGISTIISDPNKKQRVKGVFSPTKKLKNGGKTE
ncbi:LptA/OstA family protein [Alphaproteobacteria bacterium]|nr:LptA/OstA family protein [Alphaproteobacteria bacterium]